MIFTVDSFYYFEADATINKFLFRRNVRMRTKQKAIITTLTQPGFSTSFDEGKCIDSFCSSWFNKKRLTKIHSIEYIEEYEFLQ